ncbi:MAG: helix-turn-helix domain-containing protein [Ruminococcaceae bacterium]|nr:helix-turn-helix domain-containing protein [Oscillospiraceae bacterium]
MFDDFPDILSVKDIMNALDIGRNKAYILLQTKQIKSIRIGSTYKVPKTELIKYVYNNCIG